jgi:hypothetical protein
MTQEGVFGVFQELLVKGLPLIMQTISGIFIPPPIIADHGKIALFISEIFYDQYLILEI